MKNSPSIPIDSREMEKKTSMEKEGISPSKTAIHMAFENAGQNSKVEVRMKKQEPQKVMAEKTKESAENQSRGGELFKALIQGRKEAENRLKQQEEEYASLLAMGDVSANAEAIARQIAYRRLVSSGGEEKLLSALKLLDEQKSGILKLLGIPNQEKTIKENQGTFSVPVSPMPVISSKSWHEPLYPEAGTCQDKPFERGSIHELIQSIESYFRLYSTEPGHDIRMQHIQQHFRDPAKLNEFLSIHEPRDWARQFKYLYENIIIPQSFYSEKSCDASDIGWGHDSFDGMGDSAELIRRNMERMGL